MDEIDVLTFHPWPDPAIDPFAQDPNGDWSRLAWLPIIGPSSWLMWGTLAAQLGLEPDVSWTVEALGAAHGLSGSTARNGPTRRTIARLCQFRIISEVSDTEFLVRMTAPRLSRRMLERLPEFVGELQDQAFEIPREDAG